MVDARIAVKPQSEEDDGLHKSSHDQVDHANPATFHPRWLVLDDVNIDLITVATTTAALTSALFFRSTIPASVSLALAALVLLPLRTFFPRPKTPEGTVLITGASSGIGAELAYIFAEKGDKNHHDLLILVGRDEEQLENVSRNIKDKFGRDAYTIATDLSLSGVPQKLYDHVAKEKGFKVDVLVDGAGLGGAGHTLDQSPELSERMIMLNCVAPVQLTQLFGRDMVKRGKGWMLHISSIGGWMVSPGQNLYHATKHFARAFSEALSVEMRAHPDIVNTQLMPGPTHTQWVTRSHAQELVMMANPMMIEDPHEVALAGYRGLCKGKRMVFSSWQGAINATMMQLAPRSVHLTVAALMNAPLRGLARMKSPMKDQKKRGEEL